MFGLMIPPQALLKYPFLRSLSQSSRALLEAESSVRVHRRGTRLISKGDEVGGMYFVLAGVLRVFTTSAGGVEASLYRVKDGESCLLAMNAIFARIRYPAWVVVESREVRLLTVPAAVFRRLHEQEAEIRHFTLQVLSARVFDLMGTLEELSLHSLEDRLKSFLVRRADPRWEIETTHDEIATYLATAREVVSRRIKQLKAEGVITTQRGRIKILQPQVLLSNSAKV